MPSSKDISHLTKDLEQNMIALKSKVASAMVQDLQERGPWWTGHFATSWKISETPVAPVKKSRKREEIDKGNVQGYDAPLHWIDDDEYDGEDGLGAGTSSSNDRYWYIVDNKLAIVEKILRTLTRDDKTSNFQSISEAKEIRLNTISQGSDFTSNLNDVSELPAQFHEGLSYKVIADGYLVGNVNIDAHKIFYAKYKDSVKEGRKYARSNYTQTGNIRQTHF